MTVKELSPAQLDELKQAAYHAELCGQYVFYDDIPDEVIFERYDGIEFTRDNFSCSREIDMIFEKGMKEFHKNLKQTIRRKWCENRKSLPSRVENGIR
jgi:hypothetical protein